MKRNPPHRPSVDWNQTCPNGQTREVWLRALMDAGSSVRQAAALLGLSSPTVANKCRALGISVSDVFQPKLRGAETLNRARQLWNIEGLSASEIGRRLGVTKGSVISMARRYAFAARPSPLSARFRAERECLLAEARLKAEAARIAAQEAARLKAEAAAATRREAERVAAEAKQAAQQAAAEARKMTLKTLDPITLFWPEAQQMAIDYGRPRNLVMTHGPDLGWLNAERVRRGERPVRIARVHIGAAVGVNALARVAPAR